MTRRPYKRSRHSHRRPRRRAPLSRRPPPPARGPSVDSLPASLTFFLTAAQRAAVLERLADVHTDRAVALIRALGCAAPGDKP